MMTEIAEAGHLFMFEKDRHGRYLGCNDPFAAAAGLDSPAQIVGKFDADLYWHDQADFFRRGDHSVLVRHQKMVNTPEVQIQPGKVATIVTTKLAKADGSGVLGSYIDMTGYMLIKRNGYYDEEQRRFYMGKDLNNEYLDRREFDVFKLILLGLTSGDIARKLDMEIGTICWYTDSIKCKLQCAKKSQLLELAIRYGLTHILY